MSGAAIILRQQRTLAAGVEKIGVLRIGCNVSALTSAHRVHRVAHGPPGALFARYAHGRVILLRAANVIGKVLGDGDVIELSGREILLRPGLAAVERHVCAAVVAVDHAFRIVRCDPQIVVVAVRHTNRLVRFAAIGGFEECSIQDVDRVAIFRIGVNARVVKRPLPYFAIFADLLPRCAGIV